MSSSTLLSRQGHRMLQIGIALFVFAAVEGFVIPSLPVPHLGLSVHTLAALQGLMLLGLGLLWTRLNLDATAARIAFWTYLYSSFATLGAYVLAAVWAPATPPFRWRRAQPTAAPCRRRRSGSCCTRPRRRSSFPWYWFCGAFARRAPGHVTLR